MKTIIFRIIPLIIFSMLLKISIGNSENQPIKLTISLLCFLIIFYIVIKNVINGKKQIN